MFYLTWNKRVYSPLHYSDILTNTVTQNIFGEIHHLWIYWSVILQSELPSTVFSTTLMILAFTDTFLINKVLTIICFEKQDRAFPNITNTFILKKKKKPRTESFLSNPFFILLLSSCFSSEILLVYCSTKPVYVSGIRSSTKILELWKVNLWNLSKMPQNINILPSVTNYIKIKNYFHTVLKETAFFSLQENK